MTLSNDPAKEIKNGNDSATVFSFTFVINTADDMVVTHTDASNVETTITEGTGTNNYSISVVNYPGSGSVTYPASLGTELATGDKLTLSRLVSLDQETDLQNQSKYKPEAVESAFDYSRMVDLQQQDQINRSVKAPISDDSGAEYILPPPKADTIIGVWNGTGDAIVEGPAVGDISGANAAAIAASASAAAALVSEGNASASESATALDVISTDADALAASISATAADVAKIEWQGQWLGVTAYELNDAVENLGASYICITANTGNTPTIGGDAFWDVLAKKGVDGLGAGTVTSITAGTGLSGGTITSSGTIALDINSLIEETTIDTAADFVPLYDASGAVTRKVKPENLTSGGGAWVALETQTVTTAVTSVDFTTGIDATYKTYVIVVTGIIPSTAGYAQFQMRTSTDGGTTFDSGASDYRYVKHTTNEYGTIGSGGGSGGRPVMELVDKMGSDTTEIGDITITIFRPSSLERTLIDVNATFFNNTDYLVKHLGAGARVAITAVDAIRFMFDSGNIASGTFTLYGIAGA